MGGSRHPLIGRLAPPVASFAEGAFVDLATFLVQCLNAVQYGLLLFLVASGLTLIFGIMGVINLAHGSFYMIGAYLAFTLSAAGNPVQDIYLREVKGNNNEFRSIAVKALADPARGCKL